MSTSSAVLPGPKRRLPRLDARSHDRQQAVSRLLHQSVTPNWLFSDENICLFVFFVCLIT